LRAFPFVFGASALLLLAGFRLGLRAFILRLTKAGHFRRRIAVVAINLKTAAGWFGYDENRALSGA